MQSSSVWPQRSSCGWGSTTSEVVRPYMQQHKGVGMLRGGDKAVRSCRTETLELAADKPAGAWEPELRVAETTHGSCDGWTLQARVLPLRVLRVWTQTNNAHTHQSSWREATTTNAHLSVSALNGSCRRSSEKSYCGRCRKCARRCEFFLPIQAREEKKRHQKNKVRNNRGCDTAAVTRPCSNSHLNPLKVPYYAKIDST